MLSKRLLALASFLASVDSALAAVVNGAYFVGLPKAGGDGLIDAFHQAALASSIKYTVRYEFNKPNVLVGLSVQVDGDSSGVQAKLAAIPGVVSVVPIIQGTVPGIGLVNGSSPNAAAQPQAAAATQPPLVIPTPGPNANLASPLQMAGIDKLHAAGITGKGIKIGIIDTGVDYLHPALGGGFGSGFKFAGGYSYNSDSGAQVNSSDPLVTCFGGGHGTHVSGIIGMNPLAPGHGYNITGVAPDASLYMYRVFGCDVSNGGTSDTVAMAMIQAMSDGVHVINLSVNFGQESQTPGQDPVASVAQALFEAGIGFVVANGNSAPANDEVMNLYGEGQPSEIPTVIGVGSSANKDFPLTFPAKDNKGATFQYAANWPVSLVGSADVYNISDGCDDQQWASAITTLGSKINNTVIAFPVTDDCRVADANDFGGAGSPALILGYYQSTTNPYYFDFDMPSPGFFGSAVLLQLNQTDGATFLTNFQAAGGYGKYKLTFNNGTYSSPPQHIGGLVDYFSSFGPVPHTYALKPQLTAPGGRILSTWPLGVNGNYSILSGTSMATPFITGTYALMKQQFPTLSVSQITALLQTNAKPAAWAFNTAQLSSTPQQGAGLVNAYNAVNADTRVQPGQLTVTDNSRTSYGVTNITIENRSSAARHYVLSHQGAGYEDYLAGEFEVDQLPIYGSAHFPTPTVTVAAGATATVTFTVLAPPSASVTPSNQPVFGGYIQLTESGGSTTSSYSVPYVGPPYSLYNAEYLDIFNASTFQVPDAYYYINGDATYDRGFLEINSSLSYGSAVGVYQWTTSFRVDVVPANTTLTPTWRGYDPSAKVPTYVPSKDAYHSKVIGVQTYGWLLNNTGLLCPCSTEAPSGTGLTTTGDDGKSYALGPGDYRWLISVLRWGGDPTVATDYETWLGPILRMVNGPVS